MKLLATFPGKRLPAVAKKESRYRILCFVSLEELSTRSRRGRRGNDDRHFVKRAEPEGETRIGANRKSITFTQWLCSEFYNMVG